MGKRSLDNYGERKLNIKKVVITALVVIATIVLAILAITGINDLNNTIKDNEEKAGNKNEISQEVLEEKSKTIEDILSDFGGEVKKQVKSDMYYVVKEGKDYTVYLDGEIAEGNIVPWDGKEAKPAVDEAGNINIYSAAEFAWVANQVINGEKNFSGVTITLRKNIDLGARQKEDGTWEGPEWKSIIGFLDELPEKKKTSENTDVVVDENTEVINENLKRFDGMFNGNGCSIRGIKIESDKKYQGLFGYLTGTVANLTIKNSKISGAEAVGAFVGLNEGTVTNCILENTEVIGKEKVGGLIGIAMTESKIENSSVYETSKVSGDEYVGGLVGYTNNNVSIKSCNNGAKVQGKNYIGGITGIAFYGSSVQNSLNFSELIEGEDYVGGLVGYSAAQIEKSHNQVLTENEGTITGKNYIGGIVGLNYVMGDISECFNNAKIIVTGDNAGGIAGLNNSNISNCYNKAEIDASQTEKLRIGGICGQNLSESFINTSYNIGKINNVGYAGGLVGADFGNISNSFCLDTCLNVKTADTEYNKTEEELKNNILENLGDYFKKDSENINSGYPILSWQ